MNKDEEDLNITINQTATLLFSHQVMSDSFAMPWTVAHQAPLSMVFPRQEYWSGFAIFISRESSQLNSHLLHLQAGSLPLTLTPLIKLQYFLS